jgi:RNA polymerase sigma-70 factor (ECF subfamily)
MLEDDASVRRLYDAYGAELLGVATRALGDRHLAEDVVQEVFVKAWRARASFDPRVASERTWLHSIARNAVSDRLRRSRPVEPLEDQPSTSQREDEVLDRVVLASALRRLPDKQRQAVLEVHWRGRSSADLARELGEPEGTVRSRVFTGLRTLREGLDEMGWGRA